MNTSDMHQSPATEFFFDNQSDVFFFLDDLYNQTLEIREKILPHIFTMHSEKVSHGTAGHAAKKSQFTFYCLN